MPKVHCPECDAVISIENPREGAQIKCPECGVDWKSSAAILRGGFPLR